MKSKNIYIYIYIYIYKLLCQMIRKTFILLMKYLSFNISFLIHVLNWITIPKSREKNMVELDIRWKTESFHTTVQLMSTRYSEKSWRINETCCHLVSNEKYKLKLVWKLTVKNIIIILLLASFFTPAFADGLSLIIIISCSIRIFISLLAMFLL